MLTVEELVQLPRRELAVLFAQGKPFDPNALEGFAYHGVSLGLPPLAERLTWKTFAKVFVRENAELVGFNVRCEQTGLAGAVVPQPRSPVVSTQAHAPQLPRPPQRPSQHW